MGLVFSFPAAVSQLLARSYSKKLKGEKFTKDNLDGSGALVLLCFHCEHLNCVAAQVCSCLICVTDPLLGGSVHFVPLFSGASDF